HGWPTLEELDPYRCQLRFQILTTAEPAVLQDLFRYSPDQVDILGIPPESLVLPQGDVDSDSLDEQFVADAFGRIEARDVAGLNQIACAMLDSLPASLWMSSALRWLLVILELEPFNYGVQRALIESLRTLRLAPLTDTSGSSIQPADAAPSAENARSFEIIVAVQREILSLPDDDPLFAGRIRAAAASLAACFAATGNAQRLPSLDAALTTALASGNAAPVIQWLDEPNGPGRNADALTPKQSSPRAEAPAAPLALHPPVAESTDGEIKFGRRAEDAYAGPKAIKVEQAKIDRLMSLIGEMVVAKNSLPYLAARAETHYGVRELAREIKNQYAVINRIAEELQDSIMQVRMLPVSFIFQRFPRLVRDTSRKLDKQVNLILEGEQTEADKTIVEALSDPLIHIVRNSLDHGIELPEVRRAAGKPELGQLTIRARQESDRVLIEVADDGKGIDAQIVRRKAYEKGLIDEAALERLSDQEAIDLVFAPGFSTVEIVSDLSGRGVGMDVVRSAMEKVNGTVTIASERGKGTCVRLSLPLSMAVTNVIVIESDGQIFGVPMDIVVETVRVPRSSVRTIKQRQADVLRGRIVPLLALNELLAVAAEQRPNDDDELATLVVRVHGENVGMVVDDFRETVDVILKPMEGILGGLSGYSGSALLGDGSVLMVLNPKELM
ncbi:MAG: chemotaxis protein CheA, partial [Rhodocyclaceae bacterium]